MRNFIYLLIGFSIFFSYGIKKEEEKLFRFEKDGKWGYIDATGKIIIEPKFDYAKDFSEGLAKVKIGYNWYYINKEGKILKRIDLSTWEKIWEEIWESINKKGKIVK